MSTDTSDLVIIRRSQVENRIGLSRSAIYDRLDESSPRHDPSFPRPIKLGTGKTHLLVLSRQRLIPGLKIK